MDALEIANLALIKVGEVPITAFGDKSKAGRTVSALYDLMLDSELRAHNWNFAMKRVELNAAVSATTKAITGATQANPVVITATAHGFANDQLVFITGVGGMTQINDLYFTVAGKTANTFQLKGIDGTAYGAYTTGGTVAGLDIPTFGYAFFYDLPEDCLRPVQVGEIYPGVSFTDFRNASEAEWQIEGRRVATDYEQPVKLRYIGRITNPNEYDASFVEVLISRLAIELAETLTQSNPKGQLLQGAYRELIVRAIKNDAIEQPPEPRPDDTWVLSRR